MIQTKTLKEALKDPGVIEVVEGLFSSYELFPFMTRKIVSGETSPDDIITSGMYDVGSSSTMPFPFGGLLVFNTNTLIFQIAIEMSGKNVYTRTRWNNGSWSSWEKSFITTL